MKLVVGLGNPGTEYAGTRHNVGFDVVEILARRASAALSHDRRLSARVAKARTGGEQTLLVQPLSFMNHLARSLTANSRSIDRRGMERRPPAGMECRPPAGHRLPLSRRDAGAP